MKRRLILFALSLCFSTCASASLTPVAGSKDARMRTVVYDPGQVVRLSTAIGGALVVSFSSDEKITAVAVADSKDLVANPRDNYLFFKAKIALSPQPVIVLTSGAKGTRRYVFEIQSGANASAEGGRDVYYSVEFVYPGDRIAMRAASRRQSTARQEADRAREVIDTAAAAPIAGQKNWRYVGRGNSSLMPVEIYDDGFSTVFRFRGNMRIPAIYRINPDGQEAAANYAVNGSYIVVGSVAPGWRLRDGNTVLCVWNRAYDKIGTSPGTNTISARVRRITKETPR